MPRKKKPHELTSQGAIRRLFHRDVVEHVHEVVRDSEKPRKSGDSETTTDDTKGY